jgi:hypothetical protein
VTINWLDRIGSWLPHMDDGSPLVRALPGAAPADAVEAHVAAALARGPLPLGDLVDQVVERLVRDESGRGGWAAEVGVWGPSIYGTTVGDLIERLDGRLVRIERPAAAGVGQLTVQQGSHA